MPQLIPNPIEVEAVAAGDACSICWGPGKPFGDGDTPESITVNFSGINKGSTWSDGDGEPISGEFIIPQVVGIACQYVDNIGDDEVSILFDTVFTLVNVIRFGFVNQFTGISDDACGTFIFNTESGKFEGGSCEIFIPEVE